MSTEQARQGAGAYVEDLTDIEDDFDRWYVEVCKKAELTDDSPVRGCKVVRPYGYAIWEAIQQYLDRKFKALGVENAYFPLFIPRNLLEKEAEHVEGFAPEVAWVTRLGDRDLAPSEWWAVRPTSEANILTMWARWIQSYRDLPLLQNQWGSVARVTERPRAFLRTLEFLWHEGHTAHATAEEAEAFTLTILDLFHTFLTEELAVPSIPGVKSEAEKFPGAQRTYTVESMMGGKKWALQNGTSHYFGDHFGRAFDVSFLDRDGQRKPINSTSWAVSQRVIGSIIMVHGDDAGLILPPRVAPIQVIGVPIYRNDEEQASVERAMDEALAALASVGVRARADWSDQRSGWKRNEWELRGVPLRLEIGPRDVAADAVLLARRDNREKEQAPVAELSQRVPLLLEQIQADLLIRAQKLLDDNTHTVDDYATFKGLIAENRGFALIRWCGNPACEAAIKEETKATSRCLPLHGEPDPGPCLYCGGEATGPRWVFARAY
ncbi:MAG TPA: proline--tRNA ligase [Thermomicrobiales bacterium]|nr:proline--tRNA ligase [Thermomicrobiales bacterium]